MPDVLIVNDNASFTSGDTFSTRDSIEQPRHSLRRRNTVSQLTRKLSKKISQTILRSGVQEHQLSEKNLKNLNDTTNIDSHNSCSPVDQVHEVKIYDSIHEDIEECPTFDVEAAREMHLQQSYATFCQNFTLSGTTTKSRRFDLSMGMEWAEHTQSPQADQTLEDNETSEFLGPHANPEHITDHPGPRPSTVPFTISCPSTDMDDTPMSHSATTEKPSSEFPVTEASKVDEDFKITPDPSYPKPPPCIITPTVWMDMQRDKRERKAARRQRLLSPFRSWLMTSRPS
ncbi:hypothetical protein N7491_005536 [Penicillium cf. griseofulvum]|uniref:Uncharacterized protein n=1 Tax=Penicillium cf. griseofulvum TaxID=2972120 RepID=A0A9W9J6J7_9EURO|nr:hypothetical protein N7472_008224 [Penicillium cf. griseofulvum]KAJ5434941.1 hypothetical protein N7491_005536 [Penicillium cf. griseofulvum]KAJ5452774.1 hypothetical protein N7445_000957 [Penicillium cf. griseofulvum]